MTSQSLPNLNKIEQSGDGLLRAVERTRRRLQEACFRLALYRAEVACREAGISLNAVQGENTHGVTDER